MVKFDIFNRQDILSWSGLSTSLSKTYWYLVRLLEKMEGIGDKSWGKSTSACKATGSEAARKSLSVRKSCSPVYYQEGTQESLGVQISQSCLSLTTGPHPIVLLFLHQHPYQPSESGLGPGLSQICSTTSKLPPKFSDQPLMFSSG